MTASPAASVLLCSVPVHGHVTPLLTIARSLIHDGVDVRFVTGQRFREAVTAAGAEFVPLPAESDFDDRNLNQAFPERTKLKGLAQLRFDLRHIFLRPMKGQVDALRAALATRPADVVLAEPGFWGAAALSLAPRDTRPPVFALCLVPMIIPSRDTAPYGTGIPPLRGPLNRIRNRVLRTLIEKVVFGAVQKEARTAFERFGGHPMPGSLFAMPGRADLFLQFTVPSFEYPRSDLPSNVRFVGPMARTSAAAADPAALPDWWGDLDGRRVVHVTQGTFANVDLTELIVPTIRALAEEDVLVVASTGGRETRLVADGYGGRLPDNVRVAEYLPYDLLLPRVDAMVTNGGYGGVHFGLQHGVPLVVSGETEDKKEVSARVAWSGAGINLKAQRPKPEAIAKAVRRVLSDGSFRSASDRIGRDIAASGGAAEVSRLVLEAAAEFRPGGGIR